MQIQVTASDANNIICQVTPTPVQTVTIDRGVAGNGIVSIVPVTIGTLEYLRITYTNGTVADVGPITSTAYTATSPINIVGNTISLLTVPISLGGTGQTTANAGLNALLPAQTGNASKYLQTDGTNASWDAISLSTADITGVLPTANGGTGLSAFTANGVFYASSTSEIAQSGNLTFDGAILNLTGNLTLTNPGTDPFRGNRLNTEFTGLPTGFAFQTSISGGNTKVLALAAASGGTSSEFIARADAGGLVVGGTPQISMKATSSLATLSAESTANNALSYVPLAFFTGGSERVRIDTSGNVGIGTSSPAQRLHVRSPSGGIGVIQLGDTAATGYYSEVNQNGNNLQLIANGDQAYRVSIGTNNGSGNITFLTAGGTTGNTERMRIDSSGKVGIGRTPTNQKLEVAGRMWVQDATQPTAYFGNTLADYVAVYYDPAAKIGYLSAEGASTQVVLRTNSVERMRIDSSGKVGIGTSSPGAKLAVVGASGDGTPLGISHPGNTSFGTAIQVKTVSGTDDPVISLENYNGGSPVRYGISCTDNGSLAFLSGAYEASFGTERARIDSSGRLLVGTTAVSGFFDGLLNVAGRIHSKADAGTTPLLWVWNTSTTGDNSFIQFATEGTYTPRGSISYNRAGGLVAYNTTSDYRAKDITGPLTDSGAVIDSVPVYMGKMKGATQERPMFIAHEVPAYAHTGEKDAVDADGKPVYQQMDASALVPVLWAELQSLRARVAALESN